MLRQRQDRLCNWVNAYDQKGNALHTNGTATLDKEADLHLVTLPDAAKYLAVSRGALYALLGSGQLASIHIGRARRIPMNELLRFIRERLEKDGFGHCARPCC